MVPGGRREEGLGWVLAHPGPSTLAFEGASNALPLSCFRLQLMKRNERSDMVPFQSAATDAGEVALLLPGPQLTLHPLTVFCQGREPALLIKMN